MRNGRITALAALGGALVAIGVAGLVSLRSSPTISSPRLPKIATPFSLPDLRDPARSVSLAASPGAPAVVNFFFSTCVPCASEMPRFERAHRANPGVRFIGIDHFEPRADGLGIVGRTGVTYPIAWDESGVTAPTFGAIAFPATVFIDRDGRVRARVIGAVSESALRRNIAAISRVPS